MGCFTCPFHGYVIGIRRVCPHVLHQVEAGLLGPHHQVRHLLLCDACMDVRLVPFEGEGPPSFLYGPSDPVRNAARQACVDLGPNLFSKCRECTAAAQVRYARATGQPEPWPAFERTLTFSEVDKPHVEQLRQLVESFREWHPSIVDARQLAVSVHAGVFTEPLMVEAYYITDADEQRALVELIQRFLSHHVKNQAVVRFIEAENWQITYKDGLRRGHRGPERVLAEVYLNCDGRASGS